MYDFVCFCFYLHILWSTKEWLWLLVTHLLLELPWRETEGLCKYYGLCKTRACSFGAWDRYNKSVIFFVWVSWVIDLFDYWVFSNFFYSRLSLVFLALLLIQVIFARSVLFVFVSVNGFTDVSNATSVYVSALSFSNNFEN